MPGKRPKNLLLDGEALALGEAYAGYHGTTLSRLVEDFLRSLPSVTQPRYQIRTAIVGELWGRAVMSEKDAAQQRDFLERWRRRRGREEK